MFYLKPAIFLTFFIYLTCPWEASAGEIPPVTIIMDEANAALAILEERQSTQRVKEASWDRLWATEGFNRLDIRQNHYGDDGSRERIRQYLLSEESLKQFAALRKAVADWEKVDLDGTAKRAEAYLPEGQSVAAKIYPVIKKKSNSFVFEVSTNPAIFMHLDGKKSTDRIEDILAHEFHHVGLVGCSNPKDYESLSKPVQNTLKWMGTFGEGQAMLASAGGPEMHPARRTPASEWMTWERDVANFNRDVKRIEAFFWSVAKDELSDEEQRSQWFSFVNAGDVPQGAFYTVGWKMAATIERFRSRGYLVDILCDPRSFMEAYNEIVADYSLEDGDGLAQWDPALLRFLKEPTP